MSVLGPNAPIKAASRTRSPDRRPGRAILGIGESQRREEGAAGPAELRAARSVACGTHNRHMRRKIKEPRR
ncbi:hypothetical protein HMPREF0185_02333 [Brevundimonas diminuta 470-4]|nr:hypothetical protein HMPREF0185_02333 [Brevundimonas diminuta 470-4]